MVVVRGTMSDSFFFACLMSDTKSAIHEQVSDSFFFASLIRETSVNQGLSDSAGVYQITYMSDPP